MCILAVSLAAPTAGVARTQADQLQITYVSTSSLRLSVNGSAVAAGGTIAPGSYDVLVDDADYTTPRFQMSGPGVSISSDLNSTGMGIDRPATFGPFTLAPNSTYTARDANLGASLTFSTGATAGTSGGSSSGGSSSTGSSSSSSSTGSKGAKTVATLIGSVSPTGKTALTLAGRPVKTLKAGLYAIAVSDHSTKAGLIVQKVGYAAMTESGTASVGPKTVRLTLNVGRWFFAASKGGARTYFTVTS